MAELSLEDMRNVAESCALGARVRQERAARLAEWEARAPHDGGVRLFIGEADELRTQREEEERQARVLLQVSDEFALRAAA